MTLSTPIHMSGNYCKLWDLLSRNLDPDTTNTLLKTISVILKKSFLAGALLSKERLYSRL